MKTIYLLLACLALMGAAQSQSTGTPLSVLYQGYSAGHYYITLQSSQACETEVPVTWLKQDTVFLLPAHGAITVGLPGPYADGTLIKAKPAKICSNSGNAGWVVAEAPAAQVLPIYVHHFSAKRTAAGVLLQFRLQATVSSEHAVLERNTGAGWQPIFKVHSEEHFLDQHPQPGTNQYRLRLVEASATRYGPVVSVGMPRAADAKTFVFNLSGHLVRQLAGSPGANALEGLPAGTYIVRSNGGTKKIAKLF